MTKRDKVKRVLSLLDENYPTEDKCYLNHDNAWQLLVATILSAQCTDDRVNMLTKDLFKKYRSVGDLASADLETLMLDIRPAGFYRNKAKNIISCFQKIKSDFNSAIPSDIEELTSLAGVGRKTANVIRGHIFNIPSIVVDTHVKRVSNKLGLVSSQDPEKIEFELMGILPKRHWVRYNTQVIAHGRKICTARSPKCEICFFNGLCSAYNMK
ncbi:MAG: endonuclease III [Clostridiales bacterium]|jgi:endonuclease-3|nr:endonuclease III [Clostridiales bacterium]